MEGYNEMGYILNEYWHGMQRASAEWCMEQAKSLKRYYYDDHFDAIGLIEFLKETANRDYKTAEMAATDIMEYLLCIYISPNDDSVVNYWLHGIRKSIKLFESGLDISVKNKKGSTLVRKDLEEYWTEIYASAIKRIKRTLKDSTDVPLETEKIPAEVPWAIDDFLNKSIGELINMIDEPKIAKEQ